MVQEDISAVCEWENSFQDSILGGGQDWGSGSGRIKKLLGCSDRGYDPDPEQTI